MPAAESVLGTMLRADPNARPLPRWPVVAPALLLLLAYASHSTPASTAMI
jgi:hypothetical protein